MVYGKEDGSATVNAVFWHHLGGVEGCSVEQKIWCGKGCRGCLCRNWRMARWLVSREPCLDRAVGGVEEVEGCRRVGSPINAQTSGHTRRDINERTSTVDMCLPRSLSTAYKALWTLLLLLSRPPERSLPPHRRLPWTVSLQRRNSRRSSGFLP